MQPIKITASQNPKAKPDQHNLGFGKYFTDHMFTMDYTEGQGWHDPQIVPYGTIAMDPASMVLHYAQETFEGMKAYRNAAGEILLFRPDMNAKRMNSSNERICMPQIPVADFVTAVETFVLYEQAWVPALPETSLYIRPFTYATEVGVGVHAAKTYRFMIIASPVGAYYPEGVSPVKIYVEDQYVRAVPGGTGFTKCGGNYAASIRSQYEAGQKGYSQVLWLDGVHRKYIEEVGTMNVMFKIDGEIYTAPLEGSILPGITRDSCIQLLESWGYKVNQRPLAIDEVCQASDAGKLEEVFGTGTAAVISPVGELNYKGKIMLINDFKTGELTQRIYDNLTGIQWGNQPDTFGWTMKIK